jgi:hypothetical protein
VTQPNPPASGTTGGQQTPQQGAQPTQGQQGGQQPQGDPNTQGGQQTQQAQGQQQGTGGQQGQPVDPGLDARLDALLGAGQQQPQGGQQNGQGQQGGQQQGGDGDLLSQLSTQLDTMRQSISDSVRNSVLNEMRRTGQQPPNDPGNQQQGQGQQPQQSAPQRPPGPDPMDLREARMAFSQYLGDSRSFASADERALANTVGAQLVTQELAGGGTPDAAARKAATEVASQLDGFVAAVETRVTNRLRERGQLREGDGSLAAGTNTPPSNLDAKRNTALDLAKQYNAQTNPGQATG